jgi:hypothetical protein
MNAFCDHLFNLRDQGAVAGQPPAARSGAGPDARTSAGRLTWASTLAGHLPRSHSLLFRRGGSCAGRVCSFP